jgi:hypothetical protein
LPGSRRVFALVALAAMSGCVVTTDVERPPQSIVVHAVLDMGSRDQLVLLERSLAGVKVPDGASSFSPSALPILGASVTITGPNGVAMVAREDRLTDSAHAVKGVYRLSLDEYGATLQPGGRYVLRVHTDLGDVSGTTTLPRGEAATASELEDFFMLSDTLRVSWPRVDGAHSYEVRLHSFYEKDPSSIYDSYVIFADTAVQIPGSARDFDDGRIFLAGLSMRVVVSAVDANYYEYFRQTSDIFLGGAPSRLTGAIGVFGSMVPVAIRRLRVRQ